MTCSSLALPSAPDNDENVTHRFPLCIFNLNLIITYTCSTNPVMKVSQSVSFTLSFPPPPPLSLLSTSSARSFLSFSVLIYSVVASKMETDRTDKTKVVRWGPFFSALGLILKGNSWGEKERKECKVVRLD